MAQQIRADTEEIFDIHHKDCIISNKGKTVSNTSFWTNHRTCYGKNRISSVGGYNATWTIKVNWLALGGYVCIGISSVKRPQTWFYQNKDAPNYGYESTGNLYDCGRIRTSQKGYGQYSVIVMQFEQKRGLLTFSIVSNTDSRKTLIHSCFVSTERHLWYNLAVSTKDAVVSIVDFEYLSADSNQKLKIMNMKKSVDDNLSEIKSMLGQRKSGIGTNEDFALSQNISQLLESVNAFKEYLEDTKASLKYTEFVDEEDDDASASINSTA